MRAKNQKELALVLLSSFGLLVLSVVLPPSEIRNLLPPLAFLYPPMAALLIRRFDLRRYGLNLRAFSGEAAGLLGLTILVTLVPYVIGFHLLRTLGQGAHFDGQHLPSFLTLAVYFLFQVLVVAFPEEFFFRGYLQTRFYELSKPKPGPAHFLTLPAVLSILASNALFAMSHLIVSPQASRLLTFFPGLVFGWLWYRTRELWVGVVYHALCNTLLLALTAVYA